MTSDWRDLFTSGLSEQIGGLKGNELSSYESLEFYSTWVTGEGNAEFVPNSRVLHDIYDTLQYTTDDVLILAPRGSAKSTAVSVNYTTWKIGRNPLIRFLLCFQSMEAQGFAFARQIETILESNDRFIKIFSKLKPDKPERWTSSEMIVNRVEPPGGLKDPTIAIVGVGSAIPSKRADEIIGDDLVTEKNAYSKTLQDQLERFMFTSLSPILVPGGRRIFTGTTWDPDDLYARIIKRWNLQDQVPDDETRVDLDKALQQFLDGVTVVAV
ncbi:MAG: hypothetical protein M0Q49_05590 [Porticoccaceae bacterium]|nr:hypothetical protein [Porticoccaceae bacterium]